MADVNVLELKLNYSLEKRLSETIADVKREVALRENFVLYGKPKIKFNKELNKATCIIRLAEKSTLPTTL